MHKENHTQPPLQYPTRMFNQSQSMKRKPFYINRGGMNAIKLESDLQIMKGRRREKEEPERGPSRRTGGGGIQSFPLSLSLCHQTQRNANKVKLSDNSYPLLFFFFSSLPPNSLYSLQ